MSYKPPMRPYEMGSCSLATPRPPHPMLLPSQPLGGPRMLYVPMASVPLNMAFPPKTAIASSLLGLANSLSVQVLAQASPLLGSFGDFFIFGGLPMLSLNAPCPFLLL